MCMMSLATRPKIVRNVLLFLFYRGHRRPSLHQPQQLEALHRVRGVALEMLEVELEVVLIVDHRVVVSVSDCGLYMCVFVEYISQGQLHIDDDKIPIVSNLFRAWYEALPQDCGHKTIDAGVVSENKVTSKMFSRRAPLTKSNEYISRKRDQTFINY